MASDHFRRFSSQNNRIARGLLARNSGQAHGVLFLEKTIIEFVFRKTDAFDIHPTPAHVLYCKSMVGLTIAVAYCKGNHETKLIDGADIYDLLVLSEIVPGNVCFY